MILEIHLCMSYEHNTSISVLGVLVFLVILHQIRGCLRNKSDRAWFFSSILFFFLHYWNNVPMKFLNFFKCFINRFLWKMFLVFWIFLCNDMAGKISVPELETRKASTNKILWFFQFHFFSVTLLFWISFSLMMRWMCRW